MPRRSPGLIQATDAALAREAETRSNASAAAAIASGAIGYGAGGPAWLDQFRSKRAPVDTELVEQYKAIAYACIQLNAQAVAGVRCRLYGTTGPRDAPPRCDAGPVPSRSMAYLRRSGYVRAAMKGSTEVNEILEHPFLDALDQPNPFFDGSMLLHYFAACLDCLGKFYFYPDRPDVAYAASEWWPLQPQYVFPQKGGGEVLLRGYTYFGQPFGPDELETGRLISLRDPYLSGYAPLHACYEQLGLGNYYTAVVESTLKGGARPSAIVGPKDGTAPWLPEQRDRLDEDINSNFGSGRQGHIWVTDGSYTFNAISYPPADLAGLDITKNARLIACNCFGVPISLMQTEDSNRAVAEAGNYQHQKNAVRPRCIAIAAALTKMARRVDPRMFLAFDDPVEADQTAREKIVDMRIKNGLWSINRALEEEGEPPVAWGDEPWFASTLVQPSKAEERAKVDAELKHKALDAKAKPGDGPGGDEPTEGEDDTAGSDKVADDREAERALMHGMARLMARLEGRIDVQPAIAPAARDGLARDLGTGGDPADPGPADDPEPDDPAPADPFDPFVGPDFADPAPADPGRGADPGEADDIPEETAQKSPGADRPGPHDGTPEQLPPADGS